MKVKHLTGLVLFFGGVSMIIAAGLNRATDPSEGHYLVLLLMAAMMSVIGCGFFFSKKGETQFPPWASAAFLFFSLAAPLYTVTTHFLATNEEKAQQPVDYFTYFSAFAPLLALTLDRGVRIWMRQRVQRNFASLAARLGFQVQAKAGEKDPSMTTTVEGRHRGRDVRFFCHQNPPEKKIYQWSAVSVMLKQPSSLDLRIIPTLLRERMGEDIAMFSIAAPDNREKAEGGNFAAQLELVRTGDADFDAAFFFKTNNCARVKSLLSTEIRRQLLETNAKKLYPALHIEQGEVRYSIPSALVNQRRVDDLIARMDLVCDLAEQLEPSRTQVISSYA